jgi:high-affinity iron transporter
VSFVATLITWFVVVAIIASVNTSELNIQAFTGLLAVVVLLIIMNWFFHKIYWTGWIRLHNQKKQKITSTSGEDIQSTAFWSLFLLGLTSIYPILTKFKAQSRFRHHSSRRINWPCPYLNCGRFDVPCPA